MGRITIFSLEDCPHCKRAKSAFDKRGISFADINLSKYPEKRNDMLSLSDRLTVPQVFVNDTHIGGADETFTLLQSWDEKLEESYKSFYESSPDPIDARFDVPTYVPTDNSSPPPKRGDPTIPMPDKTLATVLQITELLKSILPRNDLRYNFTTYKNAFTGTQAVLALQKHFGFATRQEAELFGKSLQANMILRHVVGEHVLTDADELYFRLNCDQTPDTLNSYRVWSERVDPDSMRLLKQLKKMLYNIVSAHTDGEGKVNYKEAAKSKDLPPFEEAVCELQGVDYRGMSYEIKLAFSINLYNLMVKYAFVKVGIGQSNLDRIAFFNKVKFQVGRDSLSLMELENGILRGNRKAPYTLSPQFSKSDPRLDLTMDKVDRRIHFALNCGATSCPPVKNFTTQGIEEELRIVSQAFCEGDEQVRVDVDSKTVYLSKIFSWYQEDFGQTSSDVLKTVLEFLHGKKKEQLHQLLWNTPAGSVKIKYNFYDWSTDASDSVPFSSGTVQANQFSLF